MKKEVISIRQPVGVGEEVTINERIKDNGMIEEVRIRFYSGVERTLQVRPFVLAHNRMVTDFFTYSGDEKYISGDNDYLIFPLNIGVEYDDELIIHAHNVGNYVYTLSVDIVISYYAEEGGF